ncbi:MAG: queuosine precursor transporter [Bacteroidales bacterium]|nr:queuosine precursor transporter [Candidatus Sodaliphilus aphodohippi]
MKQNKFSTTFVVLAVLFCVCLIVSNLIEIKVIDMAPGTITAGMLVFPISYIINDCLTEVYGYRKARFVIWLGFLMNLFTVLMLTMAIALPGGPEWHYQNAMQQIYGYVPRILGASFTAFICGSMLNAFVMSKMKLMHGKRHFSLRAILSTLCGESLDSVIFFPIAFGGTLSWSTIISLIVTQTALKTLYEALALPVTARIVAKLKQHEGEDANDSGIDYKWWRITDM